MKKFKTEATFRLSARGFEVNGKPTVSRLPVDKERGQMRLAMKAWVNPHSEEGAQEASA